MNCHIAIGHFQECLVFLYLYLPTYLALIKLLKRSKENLSTDLKWAMSITDLLLTG